MRREIKIIAALNGLVVLFLVYQVWDLITLLVDTSEQFAFTDQELQASHDASDYQIPAIIHQTFKTEQIPAVWKDTHQSCVDMANQYNYTYILWTDESARDFVAEHYPWALKTYDGYPYPIMRADAIRYFVLHHFGGIYIDLDDGCTANLDPLRTVPAWLRKTHPTGISNDLMGSVPGHAFFEKTIHSLKRYDRNWFVSYITIMFSTGPLFLSVMWRQYASSAAVKTSPLKVLIPPDETKAADHTVYFFRKEAGSSWHLGDAKFIFQLGKHWILVTIVSTLLVLSLFYLQYVLYQRLARSNLMRSLRRQFRLDRHEHKYEMV